MMGILLPESIFPEMPDHKPLGSAGAEATTKVCEAAKAAGPPLVATALVVALVMEETKPHVEPKHPTPVIQVPSDSGGRDGDALFPVGRGIDSSDVVMQWHQRRQRDHWAAINSMMNMQNNPALWMSALSSASEASKASDQPATTPGPLLLDRQP